MAMMRCPECKKKMSTDADFCPNCGYKLTEEYRQAVLNKKPWYQKTRGKIAVILLVLFAVVAIASDKGTEPNRSQQGTTKQTSEEKAKAAEELQRVIAEAKKVAAADVNNLRQHLRSDVDKVENRKWIYSKKTPNTHMANNIYSYLGEYEDGRVWPRVVIGFQKSGWIFMKEIIINVDGTKHTIIVDPLKKQSDVLYGGKVIEYIDVLATPELEAIMWQVAKGKDITVRFKGDQYNHDFKPSQQQKDALKHVWGYYKAKRVLEEAIEL